MRLPLLIIGGAVRREAETLGFRQARPGGRNATSEKRTRHSRVAIVSTASFEDMIGKTSKSTMSPQFAIH